MFNEEEDNEFDDLSSVGRYSGRTFNTVGGYSSDDATADTLSTADSSSSGATMEFLDERTALKKPVTWRKFCIRNDQNNDLICHRSEAALSLSYIVGTIPVLSDPKKSHRRTVSKPAWKNAIPFDLREVLPNPEDVVYEKYSNSAVGPDGTVSEDLQPSIHQIFYPPGYDEFTEKEPLKEVEGMFLVPRYYQRYLLDDPNKAETVQRNTKEKETAW